MINKDLTFLKESPFFIGGIYDNTKVYENTLNAINNVIKNNYSLYIKLKMTEDNVIICYLDDDLSRLLHVEDEVKKVTYENMNYIAKFPVLKLSDLVNITKDIPVLFELDKNVLEYKLLIMDILTQYEGRYGIVSKDMDTLKWMNKNYPKVVTGYKIEKDNMHRFHIFKRYDFHVVDINLYNDKYIKKEKENKPILGINILDDTTYELKQNIYSNLIVNSKLD